MKCHVTSHVSLGDDQGFTLYDASTQLIEKAENYVIEIRRFMILRLAASKARTELLSPPMLQLGEALARLARKKV